MGDIKRKFLFFFLQTWLFFTKKKNTSWTCQQLHHKAIWQNAIASTSSSTLHFYINTCTQIQYKTLISTCCAKHIIILIHKKVTTVTVLTLTQSLKLLPIHTTSHHQKTNILPHMNSMGSYHKLLTWLSLELFSGGVNFIIC